jgi:2-keto-4-pentenoate hydratase/2-oxohepta-3-ene-1,7-dioic acid hydratase in catechol pathway
VRCTVDGELKQDGRTSQLIHDIPAVIAWITAFMTLIPGDVILTGTPAGVSPLRDGSSVTVSIEGLGALTNPVALR